MFCEYTVGIGCMKLVCAKKYLGVVVMRREEFCRLTVFKD